VALAAAPTSPASSVPGGLPGAATALALALLALTGAGHVLVRRGVLPLR
jgi:hypothetical protein